MNRAILAALSVWLPALAVGEALALDRVEHDYLLACAGCHRFDGSGSLRVPALDEVPELLSTEAGRDYVLRVPGVAQAPLSDERLAAVLQYVVRDVVGGTMDDAPSAEEVGRLRARPLVDPAAARAALTQGQVR